MLSLSGTWDEIIKLQWFILYYKIITI
jgi:hypothetical protein